MNAKTTKNRSIKIFRISRPFAQTNIYSLSCLLIVTAMLFMACGPAALDLEQEIQPSPKADTIDPVGNETLGRLKIVDVNWPTGLQKLSYTLQYRGRNIAAGTDDRFTEGTGCLVLSNNNFAKPLQDCQVKIEKKKTTEYKLAGFTLKWDQGPSSPLTVDFGPKPRIKVTYEGTNGDIQKANMNLWLGDGKFGAATLLGNYEFSFSDVPILNYTKQLQMLSGQYYPIELTPPDRRATIRVIPPKRDFPDPQWTKCETALRHFIVQRSQATPNFGQYLEPAPYDLIIKRPYESTGGIKDWMNFDVLGEKSIRVFPFSDGQSPMHFDYVVNNMAQPLDLKPGMTTEIRLKRIDVNDVVVTKEDGSTYTTKGSYTVFRQVDGQWIQVRLLGSRYSDCSGVQLGRSSFPTQTGIDLLPGNYKVIVSYNTAEGGKTNEYLLDLTH